MSETSSPYRESCQGCREKDTYIASLQEALERTKSEKSRRVWLPLEDATMPSGIVRVLITLYAIGAGIYYLCSGRNEYMQRHLVMLAILAPVFYWLSTTRETSRP